MTTIGVSLMLAMIATEPPPQPELLPEAPADWRFERIDFPLSFAPDISLTGFEELRFAPGMFKPDSDTYFTYVFAMKITDDFILDIMGLHSLLETYFRGLCRTVAAEKKFDIDTSKIRAQIRADQPDAPKVRNFSGSVASYDPFVTGKPLTLNFEMIVIDMSLKDHRIFAAISPKPVDSPIWKLLRTLKDQFKERCAQSRK